MTSDLLKIGVIFRREFSEKGVFLNLENTDGLQVVYRSGGPALSPEFATANRAYILLLKKSW